MEYADNISGWAIKKLHEYAKQNDDCMVAEYLAIKYFHTIWREGEISKDDFVTAVDEIICW